MKGNIKMKKLINEILSTIASILLIVISIIMLTSCNNKTAENAIIKEYRFKEVYSQPGFTDKDQIKIAQDTKTGKFYLIVTGTGIIEFDN